MSLKDYKQRSSVTWRSVERIAIQIVSKYPERQRKGRLPNTKTTVSTTKQWFGKQFTHLH